MKQRKDASSTSIKLSFRQIEALGDLSADLIPIKTQIRDSRSEKALQANNYIIISVRIPFILFIQEILIIKNNPKGFLTIGISMANHLKDTKINSNISDFKQFSKNFLRITVDNHNYRYFRYFRE